jgi:hypothetical protein
MHVAWLRQVPSGHTGFTQPSGTQWAISWLKTVPVAQGMRTKTPTSVQTTYWLRSMGSANAWISGMRSTSSVHGLEPALGVDMGTVAE